MNKALQVVDDPIIEEIMSEAFDREGSATNLLVRTQDEDGKLLLGVDDDILERGTRTLGGELLNDALHTLHEQQEEGTFNRDKRNYIVNVLNHTNKLVQGKATIKLKAAAEKRETAGFLMTLLSKATAGKLTDEEMRALETTYSPTYDQSKV